MIWIQDGVTWFTFIFVIYWSLAFAVLRFQRVAIFTDGVKVEINRDLPIYFSGRILFLSTTYTAWVFCIGPQSLQNLLPLAKIKLQSVQTRWSVLSWTWGRSVRETHFFECRSRFHISWRTHIFDCFWGPRHFFSLLLRSSSFFKLYFFWCSFVALFKADLLNLSSSSGSPSSLTSSFSSSTSSESSAGSISSATSKVPRHTLHILSLCFSMPHSKVVVQQLSDFLKKTLYARLSLTNQTARSYYLIFKG